MIHQHPLITMAEVKEDKLDTLKERLEDIR
jgi:hypothetical protein